MTSPSVSIDTPPPITFGTRPYEHALVELADAHPEMVVMTAENRAMLRGAAHRLGDRFVDVGIAEQTLVGAAAGLAATGRVVIAHALAAFLTMRAFEFIRTDVGIAGLPVKLVGFVPGVLSDGNGPTHQAIEDIGLMRQIPGLRVFCPTDTADLIAALPTIVADPHPWYIRYLERPQLMRPIPLQPGTARTVRRGPHATILSYGFMLQIALEAADMLESESLDVSVVDMRTLAPSDEDVMCEALASPLCVTVEDHRRIGGLASLVAETGLKHGTTGRHLPIDLGAGWFAAGRLDDVLERQGLSAIAIARVIREHLGGFQA